MPCVLIPREQRERAASDALAIGDKAAASRVLPGAAANRPIQERERRSSRRSHSRRKGQRTPADRPVATIRRHDKLGGLIHEYTITA
jgi:hypothetical protein